MKITIEGNHPSIAMEVEIEHKSKKATAIVEMVGGTWMLTRTPQKGSTWLANGQVSWMEAMQRGIRSLASDLELPTT
jgi:hypothetical protein